MPEAKLAECILALAGTRGHASATVGDLLEERAAQRPAWFWRQVLAILCGRVWSDFRESPMRLGLLALSISLLVGPLDLFLIGLLFNPWGLYLQVQGVGFIVLFGLRAVVAFALGWAAARLSKSRELALAACVGPLLPVLLPLSLSLCSSLEPGGLRFRFSVIDPIMFRLLLILFGNNFATMSAVAAGAVCARLRSRARLSDTQDSAARGPN
jgi:hypothetical protein